MANKDIENLYPLSRAQQGMFLEVLGSGIDGLHVEQAIAAIDGDLDAVRFEGAWRRLVASEPMLRTGFVGKEAKKPLQVVFRQRPGRVRRHDWRSLEEGERQRRLTELASNERKTGFDLADPPLMRMVLVRWSETGWRLVWTHHHILMDGWCISLLLHDLFEHYTNIKTGKNIKKIQRRPFRDHIHWLQQRDRERGRHFWQSRLAGFNRPTPLGRERAGTTGVEGHGQVTARLDVDHLQKMTTLARRLRLTPGVLAHAAWALLLARYGDGDDVLFGITVSGRPPELEGVEEMIGLFSSTVPLRVAIDADQPLSDWLTGLGRDQRQLLDQAHWGAGEIHDWSPVPAHRPLFDSVVVFENYPIDAAVLRVEGLRFLPEAGCATGARTQNALALLMTPGADGLHLELVHDRARIATADAERMVRHLQTVLIGLVADADQRCGALIATIPETEIPTIVIPERTATGTEPRTAMESMVAEVWRSVLGLERIGVEEPFFRLGGHSLLAGQVVARLEERLERRVPLRWLFERPTIAGLAEILETDAPADTAAPPPLGPAPAGEPVPLAFAQERLWFLHRLRPGADAAYCEQGVARLHGPLDAAVLERCLSLLIDRHHALRTTFHEVEERPVQRIGPAPERPLIHEDWPDLDPDGCLKRIHAAVAEAAASPFDLTRGPLFRCQLLRFDDRDHALLLSIHHIITDGWSHSLLFEELSRLYRAFSRGEPSPLPPVPFQFADFAHWQRHHLDGPALRAGLDHWRRRLAGAPGRSTIPPDRPLAPRGEQGAVVQRLLPATLNSALTELAANHGATPFMVLLALFNLLLSRYSGQRDLVIGTPVAGRNRAGLERVFGFFINTVVVRCELTGEHRFSDLLQQVRTRTLEAFQHQEVPFERVVETVAPDRQPGENPLFQVFLNVLNHPPVALELGAVRLEEIEPPRQGVMFDLTLYVRDAGGGLRLDLVYDRGRYEPQRMATVLRHFQELLEQVCADAERPLSDYRPGRGDEALPDRRAPLAIGGEQTLPALLAAAGETDHPAIIHRGRRYQRPWLQGRIAHLANRLRAAGVTGDHLLAIHVPRGVDLVWMLCGVLRAGAAFTVLDPAWPTARLRQCLMAAKADFLLTIDGTDLPPELPAALGDTGRHLRLPVVDTATIEAETAALPPPADADARAYVAFTSGSGGAPKVIEGRHRPVSHFIHWYRHTFEVGADDRFCLLAGLSHDPLLRDLFMPLSLGATLCIPEPEALESGHRLTAFLADNRVTVVHITPALAQLATIDERARLPAVRYLFFGGDRLDGHTLERVRRLAPNARLINFYGATETPQAAAWQPVTAQDGNAVIPIGRGIDGFQLLILDENGRQAAAYERGEIVVRGPGLARYADGRMGGFRADPHASGAGERLYHTGDFGHVDADGAVVFHGRRDRQVKIRGYRVEPAEIESILLGLAGVSRAAVMAVAGPDGADAELAAWWSGPERDAETVRGHLRRHLPGYLQPSRLRHLESMPLTPNGKPDLAALPAIDGETDVATAVPPRTDLERQLWDIWRSVLDRDDFGVEADFFDLGGHSLKAARVVGRIRQRLGVEAPLSLLFETRTPAGLASAIQGLRTTAGHPLEPVVREGPFPLSDAQLRLWLLDRLNANLLAYNMTDALLLEGVLNRPALERSLAELVARHESLRTVFIKTADGPRQRLVATTAAIDFRDLGAEAEPLAAARALAVDHAATRFDLEKRPPVRFTLARLGNEAHVLLICLHHILSDRWSMGVLQRELVTIYDVFRQGRRDPGLPPLPIQYGDYVLWQAGRLDSQRLRAAKAYWQQRLQGLEPLELPLDAPRPAVKTFTGATLTIDLETAPGQVRELARRFRVTPFMVLSALVKLVLHRYSGQSDIIVGTPVAGRDHPLLEGQVGCYINMLALRDRVSGRESFADLLQRVAATITEAFAHRDYPFDRLVDDLDVERELSRSPLFDVAVVLQDEEGVAPALPGLTVRSIEPPATTSKFDLSFVFEPRGPGWSLHLEYNGDLFTGGRIRRLAGHLQMLLAAVAVDADGRIDTLPMLPEAERQRLLADFNPFPESPYPRERTLVDLIEFWTDRTPDAVAVIAGGSTLTYGELDRQSNRLARTLRDQWGVVAGDLVPVLLERNEQSIIAHLAVMKAGAAYVPIDPEFPDRRIAHILAVSACRVIISEPQHRQRLLAALADERADAAIVDVHHHRHADGGWLEPAAHPDGLAYVIFTSGSTGVPKGCMVSHRNLVHLLANEGLPFAFGTDDVWMVAHSFSFDFAVWEVFAALAHGGRVVVAPREAVRDVTRFRHLLRQHRVTVLNQTPAAFYNLIRHEAECRQHDLDQHLHTVIFGGDSLDPTRLRPWIAFYPLERLSLCNMYGITETTVHVTWRFLEAADLDAAASPIGLPLPGKSVLVCNEAGELQPLGVPGELLVGGDGVCRGYLGQPALTADRFRPHPWLPGGRIYRSGDLGRWHEAGGLIHLGRNDNQVQIRGYRIELGEIESVLAHHPALETVVVLARELDGDHRLTAHVTARPGQELEIRALRRLAEIHLPAYMAPAEYALWPTMPLTDNGKIDRRVLSRWQPEPVDGEAETVADDVEERLRDLWRDVLQRPDVGLDDNFFEIGGHSLLLLRVRDELQQRFGREIDVVALFRHPSVRTLARFLRSEGVVEAPAAAEPAVPDRGGPIAIIGMAGRFPGAGSVAELWDNLVNGVESIHFFSAAELEAVGIGPEVHRRPGYVAAKGVLADADRFDADFFDMSAREAEITDPQQRLFLESAWQALEDAGHDPYRFSGRIGLFAGCGANGYLLGNIVPNRQRLAALGDYPLIIGNDKDFLAARVAYKLDLRGPVVTVGTACSTSLVAVQQACQALWRGEADMALAGGVSIKVPMVEGYDHQQGGILSADGHCRVFDAEADGTVGGSGAAVVVLRPLSAALAAGDVIHAVIRGAAINNDGSGKVGFTAPGVDGQARVIADALERAGVAAASIGYVEAHGTGTRLGDPIELAALNQAMGVDGPVCHIGSVKSNVGHLDAAAGVTGLIKAALAVRHGRIPPSLHFTTPNPRIDFGRFRVVDRPLPWPGTDSEPRRAGVSSFGLGGTNAHVILEQAPERPSEPVDGPHLLVLSAASETALRQRAAQLAAHLESRPGLDPGAVAHTLQSGRAALKHRWSAVCADRQQGITALAAIDGKTVTAAENPPPVVFLFPGQGSRNSGALRRYHEREPLFREEIDHCLALLKQRTGLDLAKHLFAADGTPEAEALQRTELAQPALFITGYALARLWERWGIRPEAMIGHSLGEYVAACLAGVFTLEQALELVTIRGRLMQTLPEGAMLAVGLSEEVLSSRLDGTLELAGINGSQQCVVAGTDTAIDAFEKRLRAESIFCLRLQTRRAFHSRLVEPVLKPFIEAVAARSPQPPRIPYVSNVSGDWITTAEATDPDYYGRHMRQPVRFAPGMERLLADPQRLFLEAGVGAVLAGLARRIAPKRTVLTALPVSGSGAVAMRRTLGQLWGLGAAVNWAGFDEGVPKQRVSLPGYPFEGQRHWLEVPAETATGPAVDGVQEWFYLPVLRRDPAFPVAGAALPEPAADHWLLFADPLGLADGLATRLRERGRSVTLVHPGEAFDRQGETITIRPTVAADYQTLVRSLPDRNLAIVHCWPMAAAEGRTAWDQGCFSLIRLGQALQGRPSPRPVGLTVVASGLLDVAGESRLEPEKAALLGPLRVLPQEIAGVTCRAIDFPPLGRSGNGVLQALQRCLWAELLSGRSDTLVAWRGRRRLIHDYERFSPPAGRRQWRQGPLVITGGLGGIGLLLAEQWAEGWAEERGFEFISVAPFDISRPAVEQGFGADRFDLVFGLNVVHATPRLRDTLANLQSVLLPGGLLAMVETVRVRRITLSTIWSMNCVRNGIWPAIRCSM